MSAILWVGDDVLVVPGASGSSRSSQRRSQVSPAVVGAVDGAVLGLDDGVDAVGRGGRDGDANLADGIPWAGPSLRVMSVQVSPPSVDLKMPQPSPPLIS